MNKIPMSGGCRPGTCYFRVARAINNALPGHSGPDTFNSRGLGPTSMHFRGEFRWEMRTSLVMVELVNEVKPRFPFYKLLRRAVDHRSL